MFLKLKISKVGSISKIKKHEKAVLKSFIQYIYIYSKNKIKKANHAKTGT